MHVFADTDTRIINFEGTIIIISGMLSEPNLYRVFIDGIPSGFLKQEGEYLVATKGTSIKDTILDKINQFARRSENLKHYKLD